MAQRTALHLTGVMGPPYTVTAKSSAADEFSGYVVLPAEELRTLLATTSEFQTWTGTGSVAAAKARIYLVAEASPARPFVLISIEEAEARRIAGGARGFFLHAGALRAMWEDDVAEGDQASHEAAENAFLGDIDTIMDAALDLAGSDDHIALMSFDLSDDPSRSLPDAADDFYQAHSIARWGLGE
jgi:hypothetical protein